MNKLKTGFSIFLLIFSLQLFNPILTHAYEIKSDDKVDISQDQVIDTNLYTAGNEINIRGTINGDVFCVGQRVTIEGTINGDLICAAQKIDLKGQISGDIRLAGQYVTIEGTVQQNATVFSQGFFLTKSATINKDLMNISQNMNIEGTINGELSGSAQEMDISGTIKKDVGVEVNSLNVANTAVINGLLTYTSPQTANIQTDSQLSQKPVHLESQLNKLNTPQHRASEWLLTLIGSILSLSIVTCVFIYLFPKYTNLIVNQAKASPGSSMGWGLLFLTSTLFIVFVLIVTIYGVNLALLLLSVWFSALIVCRAFTSILIGQYLLKKYNQTPKSIYIQAMVGVIFSSFVYSLPIIGGFFNFITLIWGLGAILLVVLKAQSDNLVSLKPQDQSVN